MIKVAQLFNCQHGTRPEPCTAGWLVGMPDLSCPPEYLGTYSKSIIHCPNWTPIQSCFADSSCSFQDLFLPAFSQQLARMCCQGRFDPVLLPDFELLARVWRHRRNATSKPRYLLPRLFRACLLCSSRLRESLPCASTKFALQSSAPLQCLSMLPRHRNVAVLFVLVLTLLLWHNSSSTWQPYASLKCLPTSIVAYDLLDATLGVRSPF